MCTDCERTGSRICRGTMKSFILEGIRSGGSLDRACGMNIMEAKQKLSEGGK